MKKIIKAFVLMLVLLFAASIWTYSTTALQPPSWRSPWFFDVDELLEWIATSDVDASQRGEIGDSIQSLQNHGEMFVPSFRDPNITLRAISIQDGLLLPINSSYDEFYSAGMGIHFMFSAHCLLRYMKPKGLMHTSVQYQTLFFLKYMRLKGLMLIWTHYLMPLLFLIELNFHQGR
ncbi:MAG: hypothetical protein FWC89_07995 [Defluviitaleaceae bacterium]|nr:hypothetical protein [Defluviitaleaceae bacterium]